MSIPIQNLYYLLCYAWDSLEEADAINVSQEDVKSMADLFARILESGTSHLLKRGLDRQYVEEAVDTSSLRGKLDLTATIKRNLLIKSRVRCFIDDLSHDVLHNQILKTTIGKLVACKNLDRKRRNSLVRVFRHLGEVRQIPISANTFSRVVLHRNNLHYRLPIEVCRLIHSHRLIDEQNGNSQFRDFLRNKRAMNMMFEKFVFRFFSREQNEFKVYSEKIAWQQTSGSREELHYLPQMRTDVCLESSDRKIVLDTKYYQKTFQTYFDKETIRSGHLYQLVGYLRNIEIRDCRIAEGILLYPTTGRHVRFQYKILGYKITVATLNLNQHWVGIHRELLDLVKPQTQESEKRL